MADEARPQISGTELTAPGGEAGAQGGEMAAPGEVVARSGDLRASHEDRDRVVDLLRVAGGDGRLTAEELDERVGTALTARTYGELTTLVSDLPAAGGPAVGVPDAKPKELLRIETRSGTVRRDGRWLVPQRMEVRVASGTVTLDFTEAVITWPSLQIDTEVRSGRLELVTKPGIVVDADNVAIRSGEVKVNAPWGSGVPALLRISVSGKVRSGTIKARPPRPPRRTFWQWLLRRPRPLVLPPGRA
jgi:hypothetical protein